MSDVLIVKGLTKRYPGASVDAVSDLSFSLPKGVYVVLSVQTVQVRRQQ